MKILLISALFPPRVMGGAEQSAASLAQGLAQRSHEVATYTLCPKSQEKQYYQWEDVQVTAYPLQNAYWPYQTGKDNIEHHNSWQKLQWHIKDSNNKAMVDALCEDVSKLKPDIVLTHNLQGFSTAVWPALAAMGIPILHTTHDFALLCPRTVMYKNGKNCGFQSQRCLDCRLLTSPRHEHAKSVDAVVGVSKKIISIHQEHGLFADTPCKPIYNALSHEIHTPVEQNRRSQDLVRFGFLGRISPAKGIETLLKALANLPQQKLRLVVGGRGEDAYIKHLRANYDLSRVEFLGYCKPAELFSKIDVFVFPSDSLEALGNSVFEAYSYGKPVIGSSQGGIPEMIESGKTGFVFPAQNTEALQALMQKFIDDPALSMRMQTATLEKSKSFLSSRRIDEYETFIQEIVEAKLCK